MLITREFVFIHLPKTAGDFIRAICAAHFPTDFLVGARSQEARIDR